MNLSKLNSRNINNGAAGICVGLLFWVAGCGTDINKPLPLTSAFSGTSGAQVQPTALPPNDSRRGALNDRGGALQYDNVRTDPGNRPLQPNPPSVQSGPQSVNSVSEVVRNSIRSPRDEAVARAGLGSSAATIPSSGAATAPAKTGGVSSGEYLQLGSVVVEVNGHPIFANKVLESIAPVLAAKAKEVDEQHFRAVAMKEIQKQVQYLIVDELEFATADRNLGPDDKKLADALTVRTREDAIRKAGGSVQLARQASAAQGIDFDEWAKDQYRLKLRAVYYQKKELPRIQISADDLRQYYQQHLNDKFAERSQAQFRVIKIGFKQTGGRDAALEKIKGIRDRAMRGEDFAEIAGSINDDPYLMKNKGDVTGSGGWVDQGAYINQKVEDAVWKLRPGDVSGVIGTTDAFYLAKLEQKKSGRVQSFDEESVQNRIQKALQEEQFGGLRKRAQATLLKDAIIYPDPPLLEPTLEMAMQKYPDWSRKK